jgi:hypothetical protein
VSRWTFGADIARAVGAIIGLALLAGHAIAQPANPSNRPFTVANYPVDATAADAVAAKEKAIADGQQAAMRSLLKRLVPVTQFSRLKDLKTIKAADYVSSMATRSERNSTTQYIASLDISFHPDGIRNLLQREGIPFVDTQAPAVTFVPVYLAPSGGGGAIPPDLAEAKGRASWLDVWKGLDLDNALAPVKVAPLKSSVHADAVKSLQTGDGSSLRVLSGEYNNELVVLAIAEPDVPSGRLHVTLAGRDAVGQFRLKRSYRLTPSEVGYTMELAAVVALGTLDGRWKAHKVRWSPDGPYRPSQRGEPVQLLVEFRSMEQWQDIRRRITSTPGVVDVQVGGITARGADVALRYPGGGVNLADALEAQGLATRNAGGTILVRQGY